MNTTTEAFKKFIEEQFDGNYNKCARSLDLAPSTIWRIATGNSKAGIKTITNIVNYCNEKKLNMIVMYYFETIRCEERMRGFIKYSFNSFYYFNVP